MGAITSNDAIEISDKFLDLILDDPDLFEVAFASVEASWRAGPPKTPPAATARRSPSPPPPPTAKQSPPHRCACQPGLSQWQIHLARSPP
jgi:hypothetical protein